MLGRDTRVETPRLVLRPLTPDDAAALQRITDTPEVIGAIAFLRSPFTQDHARTLIAQSDDRNLFLGVWLRASRDLVGLFGIHDIGSGEVEIGYWFDVANHGRGFGQETLAHALAFLTRALPDRTIVAECAPANRVSWHLLTKAGFRATGENGHRPDRKRLVWAAPAGAT